MNNIDRISKQSVATMQICFLRVALALTTLAGLVTPAHAGFVTFGTSGNQFTMEFVAIGNPGNTADNTGAPNPAGSVGYTYDIGKFEISRDMITKYNATPGVVAITLADMTFYGGNGANRPAAGISWNEAARFVNWLNTSTGGVVAYNYANGNIATNLTPWTVSDSLDYDASNPYRSKRAKYVLPSYNEWYKAAYYDPNKTDGAGYWDYATGSDSAPTGVYDGKAQGTAVFTVLDDNYEIVSQPGGPADVDNAGGLSPYGVMGLNGNVREWEESSFDVSSSNYNISGSSSRGIRGGDWGSTSNSLSSSARLDGSTSNQNRINGFRVVSLAQSGPPAVPEPSMMVIGMLFGLGGLMAKRRMKK